MRVKARVDTYLASDLSDPAIPSTGYLLSLWAALGVLVVITVITLIVLMTAASRVRQMEANLQWLVAITPRPPAPPQQRYPYPQPHQAPVGPQNGPHSR